MRAMGKTAEQLTQKLGRPTGRPARETEKAEEARTKWMFDADKKYSACHSVTEGKEERHNERLEWEREREMRGRLPLLGAANELFIGSKQLFR